MIHVGANTGQERFLYASYGLKVAWVEPIDLASFDMLVLDTEGAELLVLEGAREILSRFRYIQCEAANFEVRPGCCQLPDLDAFLSKQGFKQAGRFINQRPAKGGRLWDVLYQPS